MKHAIYGFVSVMIIALFIVFLFSVNNRGTRQEETRSQLEQTVDAAVEKVVSENDYFADGASEEEIVEHFVADCLQTLSGSITSNSDIVINVLSVNYDSQMLSMEVVEKYTNEQGKVSAANYIKTVVFNERNVTDSSDEIQLRFYLNEEALDLDTASGDGNAGSLAYCVCAGNAGESVRIPGIQASDIPEGKTFSGWEKKNGSDAVIEADSDIVLDMESIDGEDTAVFNFVAKFN